MARSYVESRRSRRNRQFQLFINMGMWSGEEGSEVNGMLAEDGGR